MQTQYNSLKNLGLNENQIETYVTLIKLGRSTATELANEAKVKRTTIYDNINKLKYLGLVIEDRSDVTTSFIAEAPEKLKELLNQQVSSVESTILDLSQIYNSKSVNSKILFFQSKKGAYKMHEDSLVGNQKRRTRYIGDVESIFQNLSEKYLSDYVNKRVYEGIHNEVITTSNILDMKKSYSKTKNKQNLRQIKFFQKLKSIKTGLFNYDNKVWILPTPTQKYSIMIENEEFAETFNSIFDLMWELGKNVED